METPICEECGIKMSPYTYLGERGFCCDSCGWSEEESEFVEPEAFVSHESLQP